MLIGILKAGHVPADVADKVPTYPDMIRRALGPQYQYRVFDVEASELPASGKAADAFFITGSATSVYDPVPWVGELRSWLQQLDESTPLVGLCFGHQIMASAFGGEVRRFRPGLSTGLEEFRVEARESFMGDAASFVIPVAYHDQVVQAPPGTRRIATSDVCPNAALSYVDRPILSFQGHPEFELDFVSFVIDRCEQKGVIDADEAARSRQSLRRADDRSRVFQWIRDFLDR